jgi:hypothetical protein
MAWERVFPFILRHLEKNEGLQCCAKLLAMAHTAPIWRARLAHNGERVFQPVVENPSGEAANSMRAGFAR